MGQREFKPFDNEGATWTVANLGIATIAAVSLAVSGNDISPEA